MENEKLYFITPAERLEYFISQAFRVKNDFCKILGIRYDSLTKYVGKGEKSVLGSKYLTKLHLAGLSQNWYLTGEGEMFSQENNAVKPKISSKGVPFYPIDVTASLLRSFSDIPEEPDFFVDFKPLNDCTAYLTVYGDSMYPRYCSGDIVAVKRFDSKDALLWGEAYLVITTEEANNLRTIKLVHQHPNNDCIILRASNPNYPGDTVVKKEHVANLFIVKGRIKLEHM